MKNDEIKRRIEKLKSGTPMDMDEQIVVLQSLLRANRRILDLRVKVGDYTTAKMKEALQNGAFDD